MTFISDIPHIDYNMVDTDTFRKMFRKELNMSKPETKSFNNIICDIKQSLSERERI